MLKTAKALSAFLLFIAFCSPGVLAAQPEERQPKNTLLIGWDGAQRNHLKEMLSQKELPNLQALIDEGDLVFTQVTTGKTQTKPGWSEILTGYSAIRLNITDNKNYVPIPAGYTVFERLQAYFGKKNIVTVFIGGKTNNIGARGPHEICISLPGRNPVTRKKTFYWDREKCVVPDKKNGDNVWVYREGEPYFHVKKTLNLYLTQLGKADIVGKKCVWLLKKYRQQPFFMFFHFEEPDEQGHTYGENSPEYSDALKRDDYWLGVIVATLKELGLYEKTTIFVTSDHGMDEGGFEHKDAPEMFLATNSKRPLEDGDRKDITPTILEDYGIDLKSIDPPLDGKPLFKDDK